MPEEYHIKNISAADARRILECVDQKDIDIESIIEFIKKRKEVRKNKMVEKEKEEERKFTREESKVNVWLAEHKGSTYREAVLATLKSSEEGEENKEEFTTLTKDEVLRAKKLIDDVIYNLSLAKKSDSFGKTDQKKLDEAYLLVKEVEESVALLVEKNA